MAVFLFGSLTSPFSFVHAAAASEAIYVTVERAGCAITQPNEALELRLWKAARYPGDGNAFPQVTTITGTWATELQAEPGYYRIELASKHCWESFTPVAVLPGHSRHIRVKPPDWIREENHDYTIYTPPYGAIVGVEKAGEYAPSLRSGDRTNPASLEPDGSYYFDQVGVGSHTISIRSSKGIVSATVQVNQNQITVVSPVNTGTAPKAHAADYGPTASIAKIRNDVPRLLAASLSNQGSPFLDMIYTNGKEAIVTWHARAARGLILLRFYRDKWWWIAGAASVNSASGYWSSLSSPGENVTECGASRSHSPTVDEILSSGFVTATFASDLAQHLKVSRSTVSEDEPATSCDYPPPYEDESDGYDASITGANSAEWTSMQGGAPPENQMPPVYYNFSLSTHSSSSVRIEAGSILSVWFPFVLDPRNHYTLVITGSNKKNMWIPGVFRNNVLEFTLPRFSFLSTSKVRGRIEGQP